MSITIQNLEKTLAELTVGGKVVLAADESISTIAKQFYEINLVCTEETRRDYRKLLFLTDGLCDFVIGVTCSGLYEHSLGNAVLPNSHHLLKLGANLL